MAFFAKKSNCWAFHLRNIKYSNFKRHSTLFKYAKFSSNVVLSPVLSNNYSTTPQTHRLLLAANLNKQNYGFSFYNVSTQHFMSTSSHMEDFKISSKEETLNTQFSDANQATDQVLFTNSSIPDSSREFFDSAASDLATDLSSIVDVAEPTLSSLGLGSWYTPVGLVERLLEFLHVTGHWPWWVSIITATAVARTLMFPIFVKTQRNAAKLGNHMPKLQYLQVKFGEARKAGNTFEAAKLASEIQEFMKQHNINPLKNSLWPLAQAPVFLSFFLALRDMAKLPVESMKVGGFSWLTDLTIPDPYYVLPAIACTTLYVILKVGADTGVRMENMKLARYFLIGVPAVMFPFCINFQSAILFYWCTNNFLTLGLVLLLKINKLRLYFGIPKREKVDSKFKSDSQGFVKSMKAAYQDQKILSALDERERIDDIRFRKAGTGPVPRTYLYDPTKPRPGIAAEAAKRTKSSS